MGFSWKLGRVAGIDLFLHPTFLLLLLWALASGGVGSTALIAAVFGCVVLHELGHALTARAFGIGTRDITLYPIGGVARLDRMPRAPGAELLIAIAGPLVNVAIAGSLALALWISGELAPWSGPSMITALGADLVLINLVLAGFNMLPAFPMDGGRVLRAALSRPLGRVRATEIAAGLGRALALVFGVYALLNGVFLSAILALFIFVAAGAEAVAVREEERRREGSDRGIWTAPAGYRWVSLGHGFWQLAPIRVESNPSPWERRSWR